MKKHQKSGKLKSIKSLILFELLAKAALLIVMVPLCTYAFQITLNLSRYSYVTLENVVPFLSSPLSIFAILIIAAAASFFAYIETVSLYVYYHSEFHLERIRVGHILFPGFRQSYKIIKRKGNHFLPLYCLISTFIYSSPLYIAMIFKQRIPAYILDSIAKQKIAVAAIVILYVMLVIFIYHGMFTMQYCSFNQVNFRTAYKMSGKTIKGHRAPILKRVIVMNLLLCAAYVVLYYVVVFLAGLICYFTVQDSLVVSSFLNTYDQINRYYAVIAAVIGVLINLKMTTTLFVQYKISDEPFEKDLIELHNTISAEEQLGAGSRTRFMAAWIRITKGEYTRIVVLSALMCTAIIGSYVGFHVGSLVLKQKTPLFGMYITSHRGYSSVAPENTLPAIQAAIDAMSDYAEIDIQQTSDGVIVLMHDTSLKRTLGVNRQIYNVTYEELQTYDAGYRHKKEYPDTKVPTFEEVLKLCQNKIFLNIEIKLSMHEQNLVEEAVKLIEEYNMEDQCVITSSDYSALRRVKDVNPDIKTGYIMFLAYGYFYNTECADFFSVKSSFVSREMVRLAHSYGKEVHAWTVNNVSEIERMKQLGVDNIITDYPIRVREIVYEDKLTSSFLDFFKTMIH